MAYENEEQVREALEKLRELSADKALVDLMMREDFYEMDQIDKLEAAEEHGIQQGLEMGKKEVAKELLKAGATEEIIIQTTKLTKEELEEIKKEIDDK